MIFFVVDLLIFPFAVLAYVAFVHFFVRQVRRFKR
jgi:hypothetical protein